VKAMRKPPFDEAMRRAVQARVKGLGSPGLSAKAGEGREAGGGSDSDPPAEGNLPLWGGIRYSEPSLTTWWRQLRSVQRPARPESPRCVQDGRKFASQVPRQQI